MDLSVVFYGTGGSVPSARRATACVLIRAGGSRILVDCGEGAQRQMMRSTGLVQVDEILITHLHADHYLGLPGLLKTYDLQERHAPLRIAGPRGLRELFESLRRVFGKIRYEVELVELTAGEAPSHADEGFELRSFEVEHRMPALGYAFVESERPGRFDAELARELGVSDVRDFGRLQRGETVAGSSGEVRPEQVLGEPRQGRKVVVTGDTAPCEMTRIAAHGAQLLVHDGTFTDEEAARAAETGHSTARAGRRGRRRGRGPDAGAGPHLVPLPRRRRARRGPRGVPELPRRARLRPGRDPLPRARRAAADRARGQAAARGARTPSRLPRAAEQARSRLPCEAGRHRSTEGGVMSESVYRVTEVVGVSSDSWEQAAKNAVETVGKSVRELRIAEVIRQDVTIDDGKVSEFRIRLGVSFKYDKE